MKTARSAEAGDRPWRLATALLVLCAVAVYANTFSVPFLFDDLQSIVDNPHLHSPWRLITDSGGVDTTLSGRPVAALTIALNAAFGDLAVAGYHAFNLAVHVLAGLLLFGVVRRTLSLPALGERFARVSVAIAFVVALTWLVHPLQTKAVTYIVQRVESLAGLLSLLCIYAYLRGSTDGAPKRWFPLSVVACALAMGTKETALAVPVLVLLHDRTFVAGSFRSALRERGKLHGALAATWLVLIALVALGPRLRVAEAAAASVAPLDYAQTQCRAIVQYLGLAAWPRELVFDYGMAGDGVPLLIRTAQWLPWGAALFVLVAFTLVGARRNRAWSFAAAAFFLVLLPSSSLVPVAQDVIAEHRMYLPLAAVLALVVCGAEQLLRRVPALAAARARRARVLVLVGAIGATALGARTVARNRDYATDLAIWSDTVAKRPGSARAQTNLGLALESRGDVEGAAARHREAIRLRPDYSQAHHNLAAALMRLARPAEAEAEYRLALDASPDAYKSRLGLGEALIRLRKLDEAAEQFERVLAVKPRLLGAHLGLAPIRETQGRLDEAALHYRVSLELDPTLVQIRNRLGIVLAQQGEFAAAAEQFRRALALQPTFEDARANLERALAMQADGPGR